MQADEKISHSYTLNLADAVNLKGENLIQDKDKLYVVAVLLDTASGRAVNCALASPSSASVGLVAADFLSIDYYNLQGRKIANPEKGMIVIECRKYADGSVKSRKVIF